MEICSIVGDTPKKGIYTILLVARLSASVRIGQLGKFSFLGLYSYTGSAIGTGASSLKGRISRHLLRTKKAWWHIDYLLIHPDVVVRSTVFSLTQMKSKECEVSQNVLDSIGESPVKGFGSGDCSCVSHLAKLPSGLGNAIQFISDAHRRAGLEPRIVMMNRS